MTDSTDFPSTQTGGEEYVFILIWLCLSSTVFFLYYLCDFSPYNIGQRAFIVRIINLFYRVRKCILVSKRIFQKYASYITSPKLYSRIRIFCIVYEQKIRLIMSPILACVSVVPVIILSERNDHISCGDIYIPIIGIILSVLSAKMAINYNLPNKDSLIIGCFGMLCQIFSFAFALMYIGNYIIGLTMILIGFMFQALLNAVCLAFNEDIFNEMNES